MDFVKKKISDIQKVCSMLDEYVNSIMQAKKWNDLSCVHKGKSINKEKQ